MKARKLTEVGLALIGVYHLGASLLIAAGVVGSCFALPRDIKRLGAWAAVFLAGSLLTAAYPLVFAWVVIVHRKRIAA